MHVCVCSPIGQNMYTSMFQQKWTLILHTYVHTQIYVHMYAF